MTLVPVTVVLPRVALFMPPPLPVAELPLTVQLVSVVVPNIVAVVAEAAGGHAAAVASGGVAADGAVGQRGRGRQKPVARPPPLPVAELPLTVQLVSVAVPP